MGLSALTWLSLADCGLRGLPRGISCLRALKVGKLVCRRHLLLHAGCLPRLAAQRLQDIPPSPTCASLISHVLMEE